MAFKDLRLPVRLLRAYTVGVAHTFVSSLDEDMSICPGNVGSNTYSTAVTVGEKAALIIAEELGIKGV